MKFIFYFPDIGEGIAEGKILQWYTEVGKSIKSGEPVINVETDKVVDDIPSPRDGIILEKFGNVGDVIKVGAPLIIIDVIGEDEPASEKTAPAGHSIAAPKTSPGTPPEKKDEQGVVGQIKIAGDSDVLPSSNEGQTYTPEPPIASRKALATPVARAMAREMGVDIHKISGSGPDGRIMKNDIQAFYAAQQAVPATPAVSPKKAAESAGPQVVTDLQAARQTAPTAQIVASKLPATSSAESGGPRVAYEPLSQIRKAIARQMTLSKHTAAHMTVFEETEVSRLVAFRNEQKQKFDRLGVKLSYLPFILKAVVAGLKKYPVLNSEIDLENNRLIYKYDYHIGIAVDAPEGLVVPVIRDVDRLSIYDLAVKINDLAERARQRKISLSELKGGTFTITNYGAIAGIYGTPIINYPEVAILGVGRLMKAPVVNEKDEVVAGSVLPLSISVDHRVVDGGQVTRFLKDVCQMLADPLTLLMM